MSCYVHQVPGRIRFRDQRFKQQPARLARVVAALRRVPGVGAVTPNETTGSVIVTYASERTLPARLIDVLAAHADPETNLVGFPRPFVAPPRVPAARRALPPAATRVLKVSAKLVFPILMERAFGRGGKIAAAAILELCS